MDTPTTELYALSLHDALPISKSSTTSGSLVRSIFALVSLLSALITSRNSEREMNPFLSRSNRRKAIWNWLWSGDCRRRSEEHTSELQSQSNIVCGLRLEKKNT